MAEPKQQADKVEVRVAVLEDIPQLRALEVQAAQLFRSEPALVSFADDGPSLSVERQEELIRKQTIWVVEIIRQPGAPNGTSTLAATLSADVVDKSLHIFELSTLPLYQRRGFAKMLIETAAAHAQSLGLDALSLTTDRYVVWNGPMYKKRGFEEIDASKLGPEHEKIVEHEKEEGLGDRRCTMVYHIANS